jgi:hypothetical protein
LTFDVWVKNKWRGIKDRCLRESNIHYDRYGGRGITLCEDWLSYENFCNWIFSQANVFEWIDGLEIDRIDNDGNYEPTNCRLVTPSENCAVGRRNMPVGKSGYTGVKKYGNYGKVRAGITFNYKSIHIGVFNTMNEAVKARIKKEIELFGEQRTNFNFKEE